ncbi:sulfate-binding protein [Nitrosococcus oceani]|nr:sulfate-binding protein [Nitrosococcus oceani]
MKGECTVLHFILPRLLLVILLVVTSASAPLLAAEKADYLPPWNPPPSGGVSFAVPPVNAIADLHGDIIDPQLVAFFAGNQFMVVHDLIAAFKQAYPQYQRVFVETLPPGIEAKQIETGSLVMGNLRITLKPDVYTAGKGAIAELQQQHGWFAETYDYARNLLAIMVAKGNPKNIKSLADLGRSDVRVAMPNPKWEGIGKQIITSYRKVGGEALERTIMETKVADGSTYLTYMHHRQSPLRVLQGQSDAAPVWSTEPYFQQQILQHPVEAVPIPLEQNTIATYTAARLKDAPHGKAARDFFAFMKSPAAQAVYKKYSFQPPRSKESP